MSISVMGKTEASTLTRPPEQLCSCNHRRGLGSLEFHALMRWSAGYRASGGLLHGLLPVSSRRENEDW